MVRHANYAVNLCQIPSLKVCSVLPGPVPAHLIVQRPERTNLAPTLAERVGRLKVFVTAAPPQTASRVYDQRMADTAAKDSRTVGTGVDRAGPGSFFWMSSHVALDVADQS